MNEGSKLPAPSKTPRLEAFAVHFTPLLAPEGFGYRNRVQASGFTIMNSQLWQSGFPLNASYYGLYTGTIGMVAFRLSSIDSWVLSTP